MLKLTLKERKMNVLQWTENNLSEMKRFCREHCKITYETSCIDDFWVLKVNDSIVKKEVNVVIGDYVVEYDDGLFTVMNSVDLDFWFKLDVEKNGVDTPKVEEAIIKEKKESDISWKRLLMDDLLDEKKYQ